ncbi:MAG TPA: O-antigen ligase family protein, partial [Daejeonella sp.]|nr:O-antigen ligase family protein [Daejeonella sp.]
MTSFAKALGKPLGFFVLLAISILFAYIINEAQIKGAAIILILLIGPIIAFAIISKPKFGITALLIASYLIMWIIRMDLIRFPLGTIMDGLLALLIIGLFIQLKYRPDWSFLSSPISLMISIWIIYNFIQVANPVAQSKMAWLYTIRSMAIVMLTYFIFSYHIRDITFIRFIIKIWLILSVFAGINGYRQQFIGFMGFEEAYLYSDPLIRDLLFINGVWRKFSIFSDPTGFSYNMIISSLLCIGMMFGKISIRRKIFLSALVMFFLTNMLFSGTRSAYVLLPASMIMLTILVFNRQIMLITTGAALFMAFLIFIPTSNPGLYRFQSAFKPSEDASFNVRARNQKMIQPYIWSHPIGGGLGSTGVWGAKFSPGSFLASFPPDSGYV